MITREWLISLVGHEINSKVGLFLLTLTAEAIRRAVIFHVTYISMSTAYYRSLGVS